MRKKADALEKINLRVLFYLREIARQGSMQSAAKRLGIDPSALSLRLKALEKQVGIKVTSGDKGRFVLTEEGKKFLQFSQEFMDRFLDLNLIDQMSEVDELLIGCTHEIADLYIPKIISQFHAIHPKVCIKVLPGSAYTDFIGQECDVVIGPQLKNRNELTHTLLKEWVQYFYASNRYLEKYPPPLLLEDLKDHRLLLQEDLEEHQRAYAWENVIVKSESPHALFKMVQADLGVSLISKELFQAYSSSPSEFVFLLSNAPAKKERIYFIHRKSSPNLTLINKLKEIALKVVP
jgi:DNA-binding transcriptional LysR family regulator